MEATMNTNDYLIETGDTFSDMRLIVEGAVALFENEAAPLYSLAGKAGETAAQMAFNTVGNALYILRKNVIQLETAHHTVSKA
ncbi:MAG: hypothetical protein IJF65_04020 [Clostridia bacterium]|nr:hypothetical protein [Clostridia bacterium]